MSDGLCVKCGIAPRMVGPSGKKLTMCEDCQREYWNERYQVKAERQGVRQHIPAAERPCVRCKTAPRSYTSGGKLRTMCEACQQEVWREKAAAKYAAKKQRQQRVRSSGLVAQTSTRTPSTQTQHPNALLVLDDGTMALVYVSQQVDVKHPDTVVDFYRMLGLKILRTIGDN